MQKPSKARSRLNSARQNRQTTEGSRSLVSAHSAIDPLIRQVAALALHLNLGIGTLESRIREELVKQAASTAKMLNGRVNQSHVAVRTGLSRPEIKRLLREDGTSGNDRTQEDRATRLVLGWVTDSTYQDSTGTPLPLALRSKRVGFTRLVRTYCGDVPAGSVAVELQRRGAARISGGKILLLESYASLMKRRAATASKKLSLANDLLDEAHSPSSTQEHFVRTMSAKVKGTTSGALLVRQANQTLTAALDALNEMSEKPIAREAKRKPVTHVELRVCAVITAIKSK